MSGNVRKGLVTLLVLIALVALAACSADADADGKAEVKTTTDATSGSAVVESDVRVGNGVVHVVDHLLVSGSADGSSMVAPAGRFARVMPQGADKVTICHATGSESNPYVEITISQNGLNGHQHHAGDVIPAPAEGCASEEIQGQSEASIEAVEATRVDLEEGEMTIADYLREDGRFTIFVEALEREGLMLTLEEEGPYTVFAPTDEAIRARQAEFDAANADDAELTDVLLYHVVRGEVTADQLEDGAEVDTLVVEPIYVYVEEDGSVVLNREVEAEAEVEAEGSVQISICHQTGNGSYNLITVDEDAVSAHEGHGDLVPAPAEGCP